MHYIVTKSRWRNRWHVHSMGHLEGEQTWLASFLNKADAFRFAGITRGTQQLKEPT